MRDMLSSGRLPVFDLDWESSWSHCPQSSGIRTLISAIIGGEDRSEIPWSEQVQLCDPPRFKEMYDKLLKEDDPLSYHVLCTDSEKLKETESRVRIPSMSFRVNDKVWDCVAERTETVAHTWPVDDEAKGMDSPKTVAISYKKNHRIGLRGDSSSVHEDCCGYQHKGQWRLTKHQFKWMTVQNFYESKSLTRDHVVLIVSKSTQMRHLYAACCMARKKITLVSEPREARNLFDKKNGNHGGPSVLRYVSRRNE